MVIQLQNGQVNIVNNIKDCLELVEPELAETINNFINNGEEKFQDRYANLKDEFESYEATNESYNTCLLEIVEMAEKLEEEITECKKLDRQNIKNKLNSIITRIYNEI